MVHEEKQRIKLMGFWTEFALFFKKIGLFLKNYGLLLLLGVALLFAVLFAKRQQDAYNKLVDQMQDLMRKHREEVDALDKVHQDELKRYAEIEKRYNETLAKIESDYQAALLQLDAQKKDELHKIVEETHDNPDEMALRVNQLFGLPIYNTPTQ